MTEKDIEKDRGAQGGGKREKQKTGRVIFTKVPGTQKKPTEMFSLARKKKINK